MDQETTTHPAPKREYRKPGITRVRLDHEISMIMTSGPPGDPEGFSPPQHYTGDPFKISRA